MQPHPQVPQQQADRQWIKNGRRARCKERMISTKWKPRSNSSHEIVEGMLAIVRRKGEVDGDAERPLAGPAQRPG